MRGHSTLAIHSDPSLQDGSSLQDRSVTELVSGLGQDMGLLIRQEIQLAKAEVTENLSRVAWGGRMIGAGAFVVYAGVLGLAATLMLVAIAFGITAWLAAAIITVLLLLIGYSLIQSGRRTMTEGPAPLQRTKQTSKETVQHLKEQLR